MNVKENWHNEDYASFRPQQGLSIMNLYPHSAFIRTCDRFRPQQGLSIMNWLCCYTLATLTRTVSVPNRG